MLDIVSGNKNILLVGINSTSILPHRQLFRKGMNFHLVWGEPHSIRKMTSHINVNLYHNSQSQGDISLGHHLTSLHEANLQIAKCAKFYRNRSHQPLRRPWTEHMKFTEYEFSDLIQQFNNICPFDSLNILIVCVPLYK